MAPRSEEDECVNNIKSQRNGITCGGKLYQKIRQNFPDGEFPPRLALLFATRKIGEGYFSKVYHAVFRNPGSMPHAVKVFRRNKYDQSPELRKQLSVEIQAMHLVQGNVNNVQMICALEADPADLTQMDTTLHMELCQLDAFCYFMELPEKQMPAKKCYHACMSYFYQLLSGLSYAHSKGVVHRDIKLDNLFLSHNFQRLAIGDYGWAIVMDGDEDKPMNPFGGTWDFMPPEIFSADHKPSDKMDMWAAACVLFFLIHHGNPVIRCEMNVIPGTESFDMWRNISLDYLDRTHPWSNYALQLQGVSRAFRANVERAKDNLLEILDKMSTRDPKSRITAAEALDFMAVHFPEIKDMVDEELRFITPISDEIMERTKYEILQGHGDSRRARTGSSERRWRRAVLAQTTMPKAGTPEARSPKSATPPSATTPLSMTPKAKTPEVGTPCNATLYDTTSCAASTYTAASYDTSSSTLTPHRTMCLPHSASSRSMSHVNIFKENAENFKAFNSDVYRARSSDGMNRIKNFRNAGLARSCRVSSRPPAPSARERLQAPQVGARLLPQPRSSSRNLTGRRIISTKVNHC